MAKPHRSFIGWMLDLSLDLDPVVVAVLLGEGVLALEQEA